MLNCCFRCSSVNEKIKTFSNDKGWLDDAGQGCDKNNNVHSNATLLPFMHWSYFKSLKDPINGDVFWLIVYRLTGNFSERKQINIEILLWRKFFSIKYAPNIIQIHAAFFVVVWNKCNVFMSMSTSDRFVISRDTNQPFIFRILNNNHKYCAHFHTSKGYSFHLHFKYVKSNEIDYNKSKYVFKKNGGKFLKTSCGHMSPIFNMINRLFLNLLLSVFRILNSKCLEYRQSILYRSIFDTSRNILLFW